MIAASSDLTLFVGRFHPVLVHLPIGFMILLAVLELLARRPRFRGANASARFILVLASPAALASAGCGWLLGRGGDYDMALLTWHERAGIAVAIASVVLLGLHALNLVRAYRVGLAMTCSLLLVASHLGGSLTHGRDYLVRYAPGPLRSWLGGTRSTPPTPAASVSAPGDWTQVGVFDGVVQPILQEYCVPCHGPEKTKAGLRLDSFEHLERGSKEGPVVRAGNATGSPLVHFTGLPLEDDSHMPPAGKPQPGPDDLALLRWWIDGGASPTAKVSDLKPSAELELVLGRRPSGVGERR